MVVDQLVDGLGRVQVAPNRSASWRSNLKLIMALGSVTLLVASAWAYMGLWMVLPIAALEVGLLSYGLYRVCRASLQYQTLYVETDLLRLEAGVDYPARRWEFRRDAVHFRIVAPHHRLSGASVYLCHGTERIELGSFLSPDDKRELVRALRSTHISIRRSPAGTPVFKA